MVWSRGIHYWAILKRSVLSHYVVRAGFKVVDKMPVLPFCEAQWRQKWSHNCTCIQGKALTTAIDGFVSHSPNNILVLWCRLKGTDWGDLDVLVLDLPPGTGDVQLTLCQDLDMSGAIGVTTPSKLAIADARKGIEMFSTLGIPTLAMVENMAYFEVRRFGVRFYLQTGLLVAD
jgi:hypothetical protein